MFLTSLFFQISGVAYIILIMVIYFSKKKYNTIENWIYSGLLIIVLITLFVDMASVYVAIVDPNNFWANPLCKLYLLSILAWVFLFTYYLYVIASKKNNGQIMIENKEAVSYFAKRGYLFLAVYIIVCIVLLISPLYIYSDQTKMYTYGLSAKLCYLVAGCCLIVWFVIIIANYKKAKDKRYLPAFLFLILATISAIIQNSHPEILLVTSGAAFITALTYFTIENPDIKMIEQLNLAKEQAEKANRAKTDFLSNMSHEIRTPLNAIVGFSQALMDEDIPPSAKEEVDDIITSSNNLLDIVNGILDISKIEANKLEIVNTEYDSFRLMKDIVALIKARIGDKPLELRTYIDGAMPPVLYGDYVRIKQIIINLLTNAVKYTKEGHINFQVSTIIQNDICRLIISVEDTGIGIKEEDLGKLFTKFERFELEKNITTEGTGLGLAITKSLVELMNGKIVVQSVYGSGSKFTVAIDQRIIPKTKEELNLEQESNDLEPFNANGQRILVVDDNKINLKVAQRLLKDYNVEVETVLSGQECINKILDGEKYHLILMDDMMPKMTGTQTLQNLKNIIGFDIPVIALTANAISGMREKYLSVGFNDYLAKPINRVKLQNILRRYLKETEEKTIDCQGQPQSVKKDISYLKEQGIDVDHGLELLGDMDTYIMTLEEFIEESKNRFPKIETYKNQKDMANYAILVHAMKSDSKYLGFTSLAEISYQHELASKENNVAYVEAHYEELMTEANKILAIVKRYLNK